MGAVTADFRARGADFEAEGLLNLLLQVSQRFAKELLDSSTFKANDVGVLLLHAGFVIVLVSCVVLQVSGYIP